MSEVAQEIVRGFAEVSQKRNLLISFNVSQWPSHIQGDSDLVRLALYNVIGNAIKYTPDGGVINLICKIGVTNVLITVQDTGIGINKDEQNRIFDRFYTAGDTALPSTSKTALRCAPVWPRVDAPPRVCRGAALPHSDRNDRP